MTTAADLAVDRASALLELRARATDHDPPWLAQLRREASDWAMVHGLPRTTDEDWRYTKLDPILEKPFVPSTGRANHSSMHSPDGLSPDLGGARLVFVNGHLAAEVSRLAALPDGITLTSVASMLAQGGEQLQSRWSQQPFPYRHAFEALNVALFEDGAFIELPPGTVVNEPIELVFYSDTGGSPQLSSPRSIVLAGPASRVTIVETYIGLAGDRYGTNAVTEVFLAEGAHVEHHKVQDESERSFHLATLDVHQGRGSRFSSHFVSVGATLSRHEVRVCLAAEGAEVDLAGLYMPRADQQHDNPILIDHVAPRCTSRQLYKGIVDDHGHGVFNGHIVVRPNASGTDASQMNKNLLLSDQAEIDTRPRLEIFTDEVICTHGAAVGRLDEEALFYLQTRGVPKGRAKGLLTYGFAHEMVERCAPGPLRDRMEELVRDRLMADVCEMEASNGRLPPVERVVVGTRQ